MMLHDAHTSSEVAPDAEHVDSEDILKILEKQCEAPMAQMVVRGGGVLRVCSRCGCDGQMLDLDGADPGAGNDGYAKPVRRISSKHG